MVEDIKADIVKQDQETKDFMTTSDKIPCKTPGENHFLKEIEDKGADNVYQNMQVAWIVLARGLIIQS